MSVMEQIVDPQSSGSGPTKIIFPARYSTLTSVGGPPLCVDDLDPRDTCKRPEAVVQQDVLTRTSHLTGIVKLALKWSYSFTRLAMR